MSALFISHSSKDDRTADNVKRWLQEQGHRSAFLDHAEEGGIVGGEDWESKLRSELRECHALVALVSAN
jgi:hypothetical protein